MADNANKMVQALCFFEHKCMNGKIEISDSSKNNIIFSNEKQWFGATPEDLTKVRTKTGLSVATKK